MMKDSEVDINTMLTLFRELIGEQAQAIVILKATNAQLKKDLEAATKTENKAAKN